MGKSVIVVGAGLSGLVCARRLHSLGYQLTIVDSGSRPGGRVRTSTIDGFRVDHGFQVLFDAYPHARLELDFGSLNLRQFEPGTLVWDGRKFHQVHRENLVHMAMSNWLTTGDKFRVMQLNSEVAEMSLDDIWRTEDTDVSTYLLSRGFSPLFLDRFIRPFFGGVFLDRSLDLSCRPFLFAWRMLLDGQAALPAEGMQAIPDQIAADIPAEAFRWGHTVNEVIKSGGRATGVQTTAGETFSADFIVVATDSGNARRLAGVAAPTGGKSCTTITFAAPGKPIERPILMVNGPGHGQVNHVAVSSVVAPELAPRGQSLVSASILGLPEESDAFLAKSVRYELRDWFPGQNTESWRPLRVDRIPFAQMPQPAGQSTLGTNETSTPGLFVAGEYTTYAGIDGAIRSGQQCVSAVLDSQREPATA